MPDQDGRVSDDRHHWHLLGFWRDVESGEWDIERTIGIYNSASEAEREKRARDLFYAKRLTHRRTMTAQEIEDSALPFEVNQGAGFETYDTELVLSRHKTYPCWQSECLIDFYLNPMTERDLTKPLREEW